MDVWQLERQIASLLGGTTWADAPSQAVLTDAFVSEDEEGNFLPGDFLQDGPAHELLPFARVVHDSSLEDRESLGRVELARFRIYVVAGGGGVAGAAGTNSQTQYDTHGENQVTGALRDPVQGQGKSLGRDVDEIVDRLLEALGNGQFQDSVHGFQGEAFAIPEKLPVDGVQVLVRAIEVLVYNATRTRGYAQPFQAKAANLGSGTVNFSWLPAPKRYDFVGYVLRIASAPNGAAPQIPTDGNGIAVTAGELGAQVTGLTTGRTYPAALFATYAETPAGQQSKTYDRWSAPFPITVQT